MARRPWEPVLEHIRALAALRPDVPACDAELLSRFVGRHDEAAFESLLRRHGPMVLRVARRALGNDADAEDVFQATFLLLARRAGAIRKRESVASWLHGVAHRLAVSMRSKRIKRQAMEKRAAETQLAEAPASSAWNELEATLHEVLAQLPSKYRTPLVYCYLEGWTQEEVARDLGVPLGTLRSWVARGRELLRKRLLHRGIAFSTAGASSALLASACATAEAVPIPLRLTTLQAVRLFAAGGNVMTLISPQVAMLVRRGMAALLIAKLKGGAACLLALALLVAGTGWAAHRAFGTKLPEPNKTTEKAPPRQAASEVRPRVDAHGDPLPPGAVARLGTVRFRHEGNAFSLVFSPNGKILAALTSGGVILWDARTGKEIQHLPQIRGAITIGRLIDFSPDGRMLAGPQDSNHVGLWDVATGKQIRTSTVLPKNKGIEPTGCPFHTVRFSPDGKYLAVSGGDNRSYVLDVATGKALYHFKEKIIGCPTFSPDGKTFAIQVWDLRSLKGRGIQVCDASTGKVLRHWECPSELMCDITFSSDGKTLAAAGTDRIRFWDAVTGEVRSRIKKAKMGQIKNLAFAPDGKTLLSGSEDDGKIHVWDVATGKEQRQFDSRTGLLRSMALSPNGKTVAAGGVYNAIRLWDVASGRELFPDPPGHSASVSAVAYSPDGKLLVSAGERRQAWLWDTASSKPVRQIRVASARAVAFSPDGQRFALLSSDKDIHVCDVATGKGLFHLPPGDVWGVNALAYAPDGKILVSADYMVVKGKRDVVCNLNVWDASTGKLLRRSSLAGIRPDSMALRGDGRMLAIGGASDRELIRLWDLERGEEILPLGGHEHPVVTLAFSPDGRTLVSGSGDRTVRLWEIATGKEIAVLKGHRGEVVTVAFSPDGRLVASGGVLPLHREGANEIRLWDAATGEEIQRFQGHSSGVTSLAFSPVGARLASGLRNSTVLLWETPKIPSPREGAARLRPVELAALWSDLAGEDARKAHIAIWRLAASPKATVPFLAERLQPVPAPDERLLRQLIANLDSEQLNVRKTASKKLEALGEVTQPSLRRALAAHPPLEVRKRLEALLSQTRTLHGEALRDVRAVEALEHIGDKQTRNLLQRLAKGATGARLTMEAQAALQRWQRREKARTAKER